MIYYHVVVEKIKVKKGDFWPILVGFWGVCTDFWRGTYDGLEHQNCTQMKFVKNLHNYANCYNPIAHVSYLL